MTTPRNRTRRDFLTRMSGLGAVLAAPRAALGSTHSTQSTQALPTRPIPGTAETLPIVGLGSSKPVLEIPTEGTDPLAAVIRVLLDHGGRVVDTSPRTPEIDAEFNEVLTAPEFRDRLFRHHEDQHQRGSVGPSRSCGRTSDARRAPHAGRAPGREHA